MGNESSSVHVSFMEDIGNTYKMLNGIFEGKLPLGIS
jgi:hypothetical protein